MLPQRSRLGVVPFLGLTAATAALGARSTRGGQGLQYRRLKKPPFQPPPWVFGPVWTALYGLMSVSAYRVWRQPRSRGRRVALGLWFGQLVANGAWTPLFFGKNRRKAALVDLVALTALVSAYTAVSRRIDRPAAWMMAPYLGWLGFAGALNAEIVRRND